MNTIRQPIDMEMDIASIVKRRLDRYDEKGLDFTMDISSSGKISAPRREFTHALVHLVDNAFKFTSKMERCIYA